MSEPEKSPVRLSRWEKTFFGGVNRVCYAAAFLALCAACAAFWGNSGRLRGERGTDAIGPLLVAFAFVWLGAALRLLRVIADRVQDRP